MKRQIENMIPHAVLAVKEKLCKKENKSQVNEAYDGYIASYCSAITQSGLLAATAMYTDNTKTEKTKGDKTYLMDALLRILVLEKADSKIEEKTLFEYILNSTRDNPQRAYQIKAKLMDASVALKLALRTFEQVK